MIRFKLDSNGGFVAGDTTTGVTVYAYPSSTHAVKARKDAKGTAREMIEAERPYLHTSEYSRQYDSRNWETIGPVDYRMSVQCKEPTTGETGCFIHDTDGNTVSPLFKDLAELYPWMRENGWKTDEYPDSRPGTFVPWRVSHTA